MQPRWLIQPRRLGSPHRSPEQSAPTVLKSTRAAQQHVGGLEVRMHHSELEGQSREHTSQDVPHPCHFQLRLLQELPDVCVEALEDQANRT